LDEDAIREASTVDINDVESLPQFEDSPHPVIKELSPGFFDVPLSMPPGKEMSYSNFGYELLGDILRSVSSQSLSDFAQSRLFGPLGMKDSSFVLPESVRHRLLRRPESAPAHALLEWATDIPFAAGGVCSTASDIAIFCQMFLNGGSYDGNRILSPAAVNAMTRNQTPGIPTTYHGTRRLESSWGYGWMIRGHETWAYQPSTLMSPETFRHGGAGGTYMWVDPVNDLVGIYLSVALEEIDGAYITQAEHFSNAITAAIDD
jgi:CubicO group peptidase (beta-lactamase class C family)